MIVKNSGQILGEVVIAIGVIMLVLIGMSSLMSRSTKTIRQNDVKDEAVKLVESQIRSYKEQRDRDITSFFSNLPPERDVALPCTWTQPTPTPVEIPVTCLVTYSDIPAGNGIGIAVKAVWTEELPDDRDVSLSVSLMRF